MDFVKWVKDIVYMCAQSAICDEDACEAMSDYEVTELAEEIANLVELEINAHRQENKVPPIPQEILQMIAGNAIGGPTFVEPKPIGCFDIDDLVTRIHPSTISGERINIGYSGRPIAPRLPEPVKAWFNPPYTTVEFSDGDKVTVEQTDFEDSKFSEYAGYCCAVTKKLFGTSTAAFKRFEAAKKKAIEDSPKFKKAKARRFEKERKAMIREEARRRREFQIHMEMERLKTEQEARKRLESEK